MIHKAPTTWNKRGHPMILPPVQKRALSFPFLVFLSYFLFFWLPNHPPENNTNLLPLVNRSKPLPFRSLSSLFGAQKNQLPFPLTSKCRMAYSKLNQITKSPLLLSAWKSKRRDLPHLTPRFPSTLTLSSIFNGQLRKPQKICPQNLSWVASYSHTFEKLFVAASTWRRNGSKSSLTSLDRCSKVAGG